MHVKGIGSTEGELVGRDRSTLYIITYIYRKKN